ncbi:PREDICTED: dihydroflavonol 4-reductase-like [Ipomoea nil]|uniref:dihydroflavonol 4-reductase-like n=1 Tax=Ipomoea nil TaxID=35883 RepID=UPI00090107EF|nr:PREDICTED: dihydroflavonol 4-reductase-like [Ipomoea nil]
MMHVCVTGGAGYLASFLIKTLLSRGYTVHATLRNLGDSTKVGLLKGLPGAETNLKLFEADIYRPDEFVPALHGCQVVLHLATPLLHNQQSSKYKNTSEAAVDGVRSIVEACIRAGTVKKLIYTASVMAAAPLSHEDATSFKDSMDETCWTPSNFPIPYPIDLLVNYVHSKTAAEKEVLSYNGRGIQVVSLACGLVGGRETLQSVIPESVGVIVSQVARDKNRYEMLRFLEELLSKVPLVHIQDVTAAHVFCIENSDINGRFLCANSYLKSVEIASYYQHHSPLITIPQEFIEDSMRETKWGSRKLEEAGFEYKYDYKMTLNGSLECAKKFCNLLN